MAEFKVQGLVQSYEPALGQLVVRFKYSDIKAIPTELEDIFTNKVCFAKFKQIAPDFAGFTKDSIGDSVMIGSRLPRLWFQFLSIPEEGACQAYINSFKVESEREEAQEVVSEYLAAIRGYFVGLVVGTNREQFVERANAPEKTYRKYDENPVTAGSPAAFSTLLAFDDETTMPFKPFRVGGKVVLTVDTEAYDEDVLPKQIFAEGGEDSVLEPNDPETV